MRLGWNYFLSPVYKRLTEYITVRLGKKKSSLLHCLHFRYKWLMSLLLCLFSPPLAQPNPPKIHEGWWAYKEVVQGSFVPGMLQNCVQHFDAYSFHNTDFPACTLNIIYIVHMYSVCLIQKSMITTHLRLHRATLPFSHS